MYKMKFQELDEDTQKAVLANRSIPILESELVAACASGDNDRVAEVTRQYNEARGLPTDPPEDPNTGTTGTPDYGPYEGPDWDRDTLEDTANERGLTVEGTGKDGYVTKANYRDALKADDAGNEGASA